LPPPKTGLWVWRRRTIWTVADPDAFVRGCADVVRSRREDAGMARTHGTMSPIELVFRLRGIPSFAWLEPQEPQRVAAIAAERLAATGTAVDAST
jgi:hypothetical protein